MGTIADRLFHAHAQAILRLLLQRRRGHAGSTVLVRPQDVDSRHEWNSEFCPFFSHTLLIGKNQK
jgi:hypothetical protein